MNKFKMNKRGIAPIALVMAMVIGVFFLVAFASGGLKATYDFGKFISDVPPFIWAFLGVLLIFRMFGGKK